MAMKPANVIQKADLTAYALQLLQDMDKIRGLCDVLAPVVPTGVTAGRFNKFESTAAFTAYTNAQRAIGGNASIIKFLSDTANFNCNPYGLRISMDSFERDNAGAFVNLVEQAKTRTLTVNCLLSHLSAIVTAVVASVSAASGKGNWSSANVDPIEELDGQIEAMWKAIGIIPNNLVVDFGAWLKLKNNPNVLKRMSGADLQTVTPQRVGALLVNPNCQITIAEAAVTTGGGFGNSSATRTGILGTRALLFFNSPVPTQYDPSFCKTFSPSGNLFTEVYSYEEAPHLTWYENDWTADIQVVSSACARLINVT